MRAGHSWLATGAAAAAATATAIAAKQLFLPCLSNEFRRFWYRVAAVCNTQAYDFLRPIVEEEQEQEEQEEEQEEQKQKQEQED